MTPLHYAVCMDNEFMIKKLIEANADFNVKDNDGNTPLELADNDTKIFLEKLICEK